MKKSVFLLINLLILLLLSACGVVKPITRGGVSANTTSPKNTTSSENTTAPKPPTLSGKNVTTETVSPSETKNIANISSNAAVAANQVVDFAKTYLGTPYKSGGTSKEGTDCSGLVFASYLSIGMKLPRTSSDMSKFGVVVDKEPKLGDLVFFDSNNAGRINHVGLVSKVASPENADFIHASCSKGVIESKLTDGYWKDKHRKTMRVLGVPASSLTINNAQEPPKTTSSTPPTPPKNNTSPTPDKNTNPTKTQEDKTKTTTNTTQTKNNQSSLPDKNATSLPKTPEDKTKTTPPKVEESKPKTPNNSATQPKSEVKKPSTQSKTSTQPKTTTPPSSKSSAASKNSSTTPSKSTINKTDTRSLPTKKTTAAKKTTPTKKK